MTMSAALTFGTVLLVAIVLTQRETVCRTYRDDAGKTIGLACVTKSLLSHYLNPEPSQ